MPGKGFMRWCRNLYLNKIDKKESKPNIKVAFVKNSKNREIKQRDCCCVMSSK